MKKALFKRLLTLTISLSLLVSCQKNKEEPQRDNFIADVYISAAGREYHALYEKYEGGERMTLLSPNELSGLEFTKDGSGVYAVFEDMRLENDCFSSVFDFTPISCDEIKTVKNRSYTVKLRQENLK